MNLGKITVPNEAGGTKKIAKLKDFVEYKKGDTSLIVAKKNDAGLEEA